MNHSFDIEIAKEYGIEEAILLNHFEFWLSKNNANKKHFHENRYWTYNSLVALEELFPYMTARKIRTTIESLKDKGLILTGNYNANSYDRTMWYSLSDLGICILQKRQLHLTETANGNDVKVKPIPDTLQIINTDTVEGAVAVVVDKEFEFNKFWQLYPRKQSKASALKSWNKVKPLEYDKIFESLPVFIKSEQWTKSNGEFIPYPATWLNQQRWNDEVSKSSKPCISEGKKIDGGWQL